MTLLTFKRFIINLFIDIKNKIFHMIDNNNMYFTNTALYSKFLKELADVLSNTLVKIEDIYFKYFLLPKLQQIKY